jgi:hypothetical protein
MDSDAVVMVVYDAATNSRTAIGNVYLMLKPNVRELLFHAENDDG